MRSCNNCGASIPEDATTCPVCGCNPGTASSPASSTPEQGRKQSKSKKKGPLKFILIALAVIVVLGIGVSRCSEGQELEEWPTGAMAQMIPSMNHKCSSVYDFDDSLSINTEDGVSKQEFDAYVSECKERGFDIVAEEENESFEAFNQDGYKLTCTYHSSSKSVSIDLEEPKAAGTLQWPKSGPATLLPNPEKSKGNVDVDSSSQLHAYVGNMSKAEYQDYVDKCIDLGFDVDYSKSNTYFEAEDKNGNSLSLTYEESGVMEISLDVKDKAAAKKNTADESKADKAKADTAKNYDAKDSAKESAKKADTKKTDAKSSSFKETMDEYETFMDDYIAFMKKYEKSDNVAAMMVDYASMMDKYAKWASKIEKIDEGELSESDYAYYVKVQARVTEKLAEASL